MLNKKLLMFALLLFSQLLFAGDLLDNGVSILGATVLLMVITLASCNMIAAAFNMPGLEAWVKTEVREMIAGAILFAIVGVLVYADVNPIAAALTVGATDNYKTSINSFVSSMQTKYTNAYYDVLGMSHYLTMSAGLATSLNIPIYYFGLTQSGTPAAGFGAFLVPVAHAAGALSNGMYIYALMKLLLDFFSAVSVPILPFAFAFRFIPFTRQLGNTLIALVIGANIIFPASIILIKDFHSMIDVPTPSITGDAWSEMDTQIPGAGGLDFICGRTEMRMLMQLGELALDIIVCIPVALATLGTGWEPCKQVIENIVWPIIQLILMIYIDVVLLIAQFAAGGDPDVIFEAIFQFSTDTTGLVLVAYIDAIVVGTFTIVGTRSIASALGGEYFLGSISRLV